MLVFHTEMCEWLENLSNSLTRKAASPIDYCLPASLLSSKTHCNILETETASSFLPNQILSPKTSLGTGYLQSIGLGFWRVLALGSQGGKLQN